MSEFRKFCIAYLCFLVPLGLLFEFYSEPGIERLQADFASFLIAFTMAAGIVAINIKRTPNP